jgi:hypothetical protein
MDGLRLSSDACAVLPMKTGELIEAMYGAAVGLGLDTDTAASWAGLCVALALRAEWGEA